MVWGENVTKVGTAKLKEKSRILRLREKKSPSLVLLDMDQEILDAGGHLAITRDIGLRMKKMLRMAENRY